MTNYNSDNVHSERFNLLYQGTDISESDTSRRFDYLFEHHNFSNYEIESLSKENEKHGLKSALHKAEMFALDNILIDEGTD